MIGDRTGLGRLPGPEQEHCLLRSVAVFPYARLWTLEDVALNHLHTAIEAQPLCHLTGKVNDAIVSEASDERLLGLPLFSEASFIALFLAGCVEKQYVDKWECDISSSSNFSALDIEVKMEVGGAGKKNAKKEDVPRPGIEPGIFRLQLTITAGRHNQLDHQGLSVSTRRCSYIYTTKLSQNRSHSVSNHEHFCPV